MPNIRSKTNEKVSILIPNYNSEKFIEQTLKSAISQTYKNIEIIIVDNCSTDGSWDIIQRFASAENRIKAYRNDENIGPVRNWQRCIDNASAYYAKFLWSDDYIANNFIEKTIEFIINPEVGFVFTKTIRFEDNFEKSTVQYNIGKSGIYPIKNYQHGILIGGDYPVSPGCALFRLEDLRKNLLLNIPNNIGSDFSKHAIGNDLLIYLLTSASYRFYGYVDEPLAFFRAHEKSITSCTDLGKLLLLYSIVKAFFIENYYINNKLIKKFNSNLLLLLLKYNNNNLNLKNISDFYIKNKNLNIDYLFFIKNIIKIIYTNVKNF